MRPRSVGPCWAGRCEQGAAGSLPVVSPLKLPCRLLPPSPRAGACWRFRESRERPIHHARALRGALPPSVCLSVCLSIRQARASRPAAGHGALRLPGTAGSPSGATGTERATAGRGRPSRRLGVVHGEGRGA